MVYFSLSLPLVPLELPSLDTGHALKPPLFLRKRSVRSAFAYSRRRGGPHTYHGLT